MNAERPGYPLGAEVTLEQLTRDPHPLLARMREQEPVSWVPVFSGWLVTGRELAIAAMRDAATFTVDDPRFSTSQVIGPSMLSLDGAEHARHRTPFVAPFTAPSVQELGDRIRERAKQLLRDLAPQAGADLRSAYAAPLAIGVMTDTLGLEGVQSAELWSWYVDIVAAVDEVTAGHPVPSSGAEAFDRLKEAVTRTISADSDSMPGTVARTGDLTPDEVVSNIAVLLFGGIVTTEATTTTLLHQLLGSPEDWAALLQDRALVPRAVEEALRFEPAAAVVDRYATSNIFLGEAQIAEGDLVRISLSAPNRDPDTFPEPDRFDIRRKNANQHLAFARGPHACLGIHLARLEAMIAVETLLDRMPGLRAAEEGPKGPDGLIFRGPPSVEAIW